MIALVVAMLALIIAVWSLVTRRRITGVAKRPQHPVEELLKELLERSRANAGRVHIHDVEETIRRRLG